MTNDVDVVGHLGGCFDATYRALGEMAPHLGDDSFVVVSYEMGRAFGEVALSMRAYAPTSLVALPVIGALFDRALTYDPSGGLGLYALAVVVGPRLLVSLRDALEVVTEPAARALFAEAQGVTVRQILRVGELDARGALEEQDWRAGVKELAQLVDFGPYAESFGLVR